MTANFNDRIAVTTTADAQGVTRQTFGDVLLITTGASFGAAGDLRAYTSSAAAVADSDLDAATQSLVADFFSQSPNPGRMVVGQATAAYADMAGDLALFRADASLGGFYGIATASRAEADILALAAAVEADSDPGIFVAQTSDAAVLAGTAGNVAEDLAGFNYTRTALVYHATDTDGMDLGWLSSRLAANPDNTTTTWDNATLVGFTAAAITSTQKSAVTANNANLFLPLYGVDVMGEGTTANGKPIDELVSRDWYEARAAERCAQAVINAAANLSKNAYDPAGIAVFESILLSLHREGVGLKHFEDSEMTISKPEFEDVPDADKINRIVRLTASAKLAGAISETDFTIAVLSA